MNRLLLPTLLLALLALACEPIEDAATPTPTPAPTPTPTPTAAPVDGFIAGPKVVFIRGVEQSYPLQGVLWMSDLDGGNQEQLTPDEETAAFVALMPDAESGAPALYYVSLPNEDAQTLWKLNLSTHERMELLTRQKHGFLGGASVSPDGRYIAYVDTEGLAMLDARADETRDLLLAGDREACVSGEDLTECAYYAGSDWSPDGRLLLVTKGFYEGASVTIVDPFSDPPVELIETHLGDRLPSSGNWSPSGESICAYGQYAEYTSLYIASTPGWTYRNVIPAYEDQILNDRGRMLLDCEWLNETTVAFVNVQQTPSELGELLVLDTTTEESREVVVFEDEYRCCNGSLTLARSQGVAIAQFLLLADDRRSFYWAQPLLVRLDGGTVQPLLGDGDYVVTVVPSPGALPATGSVPPTP
jgi:hypothetical protein